MVILYAILVLSTLTLLWAAAACYFRIRRHLRDSESAFRQVLTEIEGKRDIAAV